MFSGALPNHKGPRQGEATTEAEVRVTGPQARDTDSLHVQERPRGFSTF